jgi:hypothetical protein
MEAAGFGHDSFKCLQMEPNGKRPIKMRVSETFLKLF